MKKFKAFSLLELMIVLTIMGILMVSISQGTKLLEKAKVQKTVNQITLLKTIDKGDISIDSTNEQIWEQLIKNNQVSLNEKTPAIGGLFTFENTSTVYLSAKDKKGFLTLSMAKTIKTQIDGTLEEGSGCITILLGSNFRIHPDNHNEKAYILEIAI